MIYMYYHTEYKKYLTMISKYINFNYYKKEQVYLLFLFLLLLGLHVGHNHLVSDATDIPTHSRWNYVIVQDLLSQATMSPPLPALQ